METLLSDNNTVRVKSLHVRRIQEYLKKLTFVSFRLHKISKFDSEHRNNDQYDYFRCEYVEPSTQQPVACIQDYLNTLCDEFEKQDTAAALCKHDTAVSEIAAGDDSSYDSDFEGSEDQDGHGGVSRTVSDTLAAEFSEYVSISSNSVATSIASESTVYISRFLEFGLKLGYTERLVQAALQKLGPNPEQNELLAELIKLGSQPGGANKSVDGFEETIDNITTDINGYVITQTPAIEFRPIVIDGSNVAMSHGNKEVFSCRGIKICVDWFRSRGHTEITVFVPKWRKESPRLDNLVIDQEILYELERERLLVFTPSREIRGKRMVCYDDRYILKLASENDGIVVSNDNYRDLIQECPEYRKVVEERILMYSFVNDRFMPPDDPLGRAGPMLENFLKIQPQRKAETCPYGKKCTYGNKCKYNHPERGCLPHKSVTEKLVEHAQKQLQARNQQEYSGGIGKQLKGKSISLPLQSSTSSSDELAMKSIPKKTTLSRTKSSTSANNRMDSNDEKQRENVDKMRDTCFLAPPTITYPHPHPWPIQVHNNQWNNPTATSCRSFNPIVGYQDHTAAVQHRLQETTNSGGSGAGLSLPPPPTNQHRKLQRQLSINPISDSRIYQMQKFLQSHHPPALSTSSSVSSGHHQNISRHCSYPNSEPGFLMPPTTPHSNVTRIASAPPSNPHYNHILSNMCNNMASASDSQINCSVPATMNLQSYSTWGVSNCQQNFSCANAKEESRQKLRYHLASIFPEEQVDTVLQLYPNETNPQKICAAIISMFPTRS